jgi:hypothetical protein
MKTLCISSLFFLSLAMAAAVPLRPLAAQVPFALATPETTAAILVPVGEPECVC